MRRMDYLPRQVKEEIMQNRIRFLIGALETLALGLVALCAVAGIVFLTIRALGL